MLPYFPLLRRRGRGGGTAPFSLECINDPGSRPDMFLFKIGQDLYDLVPLFRVAHKRPPDEDGMAYYDG
jgi:hypothetical protein